MPILTIQIVGWNSEPVLTPGLKALATIPDNEILVRYLDNGSTDNSVELVRNMVPNAHIIELKKNTGFSYAHNIGFSHCTTPYVLVHDPDGEIDWPGIKKLLNHFTDPTIAAVQGKLLRRGKNAQGKKIIDSVGINLTRALNGYDRGANQEDTDQFNFQQKIMAVTGACGLYRMAALKSIAHSTSEIYDHDFFAYKEDVDLGWRLNKAGYTVLYVPILMGYHNRTLGKRGIMNWGVNPVTIYKRLQSPRTRYSLRNWVWMIVKNMSFTQELKAELFIDVRLFVFFILTILYPPLCTVWVEVLHGLPRMFAKRTV